MDIDDGAPHADAPLDALEREDLTLLSRGELEDRIARLGAETARARAMLASKSDHASAAESLFKKE